LTGAGDVTRVRAPGSTALATKNSVVRAPRTAVLVGTASAIDRYRRQRRSSTGEPAGAAGVHGGSIPSTLLGPPCPSPLRPAARTPPGPSRSFFVEQQTGPEELGRTARNLPISALIMRRALVILENGCQWPDWLDSQDLDSFDLVTQRPGETSPQLARRVVERLSDRATRPVTATLVCSPLGGAESNRARSALLRGLLGSAVSAGSGHVVLVADGSQPQRRELARLAAALDREIRDEPMVSLRFRALSRRQSREPRQRRVA